MMLDTVIFDLGGVLVDFHPVSAMKEIGFAEEVIAAFNEKIFSGLWEECDRYPYEDAEIRKILKKHIPEYENEVDLLWDNISAITSVKDYTDNWIKALKEQGLKLYVLSNYGRRSFEINSKIYDFLKYMDGLVISYQYKYLKPEPELYEILLNKYNINREKAVFIDDRMINIKGAQAVGLNALLFENYQDAENELISLINK